MCCCGCGCGCSCVERVLLTLSSSSRELSSWISEVDVVSSSLTKKPFWVRPCCDVVSLVLSWKTVNGVKQNDPECFTAAACCDHWDGKGLSATQPTDLVFPKNDTRCQTNLKFIKGTRMSQTQWKYFEAFFWLTSGFCLEGRMMDNERNRGMTLCFVTMRNATNYFVAARIIVRSVLVDVTEEEERRVSWN